MFVGKASEVELLKSVPLGGRLLALYTNIRLG
jgi:hypothetical protein